MATDAEIKTAISAGLRKCVPEDGTPVPLIKDADLMHVTHMVWTAIAPLLDSNGPGSHMTGGEWAEWSNELASLIPDGDESRYSNPEGAQESIITDCLRAYVAERGEGED